MDAAALSTAKQYLRRKYYDATAGTFNVAALRALADQVATEAFETVTITGQTFEGGSHQGQVVFPRMQYLQALEELITELDPDNSPAVPFRTSFADFGCQPSIV